MGNVINKVQIKYRDNIPSLFIDIIEIKGIKEYVYTERCSITGIDRELMIKLGDFDIEISDDKEIGE